MKTIVRNVGLIRTIALLQAHGGGIEVARGILAQLDSTAWPLCNHFGTGRIPQHASELGSV